MGLACVVKNQVLQPQANHAIAELLETVHVERNVVIGAENVAGAAAVGVLDIGQHAVQREHPERPAVHFPDATKVAKV